MMMHARSFLLFFFYNIFIIIDVCSSSSTSEPDTLTLLINPDNPEGLEVLKDADHYDGLIIIQDLDEEPKYIENLHSLISIGSLLILNNNFLHRVNFLHNLVAVHGEFSIVENENLETIELPHFIGANNFYIYDNPKLCLPQPLRFHLNALNTTYIDDLMNCSQTLSEGYNLEYFGTEESKFKLTHPNISNLEYTEEDILAMSISNVTSLLSIQHIHEPPTENETKIFSRITEIGSLLIHNCSVFQDLSFLPNLNTIYNDTTITNNTNLTSLSTKVNDESGNFFSSANIRIVKQLSNLHIRNMPSLSICDRYSRLKEIVKEKAVICHISVECCHCPEDDKPSLSVSDSQKGEGVLCWRDETMYYSSDEEECGICGDDKSRTSFLFH